MVAEITSSAAAGVFDGWLFRNAEVCTISVREVSGQRNRLSREQKYDIKTEGLFRQTREHVHFRIEFTVSIQDEDDDAVGHVSTVIIANYKTGNEAPEIDPQELVVFGETVASNDIFPYARNTLGQLALQVGFDARHLVRGLDAWSRGHVKPRGPQADH